MQVTTAAAGPLFYSQPRDTFRPSCCLATRTTNRTGSNRFRSLPRTWLRAPSPCNGARFGRTTRLRHRRASPSWFWRVSRPTRCRPRCSRNAAPDRARACAGSRRGPSAAPAQRLSAAIAQVRATALASRLRVLLARRVDRARVDAECLAAAGRQAHAFPSRHQWQGISELLPNCARLWAIVTAPRRPAPAAARLRVPRAGVDPALRVGVDDRPDRAEQRARVRMAPAVAEIERVVEVRRIVALVVLQDRF